MKVINFISFLFMVAVAYPQSNGNKLSAGIWQAGIVRSDNDTIPFAFEVVFKNAKPVIHLINGQERFLVDSLALRGDSLFIDMPLYESSFKAILGANTLSGVWIKGTTSSDQVLPFFAHRGKPRFIQHNEAVSTNISGRWAIAFEKDSLPSSVGEFKQTRSKVEGTIMTPGGDYRYLEGVVTGNQLLLSGFDGVHAVLFKAKVEDNRTLIAGTFISGAKHKASWSATMNNQAKVNLDKVGMFLKASEYPLNFTFPDVDSNMVSFTDQKYKNKVVVLQLMGSWCPNCMDETAFLTEYYQKNVGRGFEVIALAYEYSTDFARSKKSILKVQKRYNVPYPILITGVSVSDSLSIEKTLPQLTKIKVFPTSVIIDKSGKIRSIDTGFVGPAAGIHYEKYKREFEEKINELIKE